MRTGEVYFSRINECFYEVLMGEDRAGVNFVKVTYPSGQVKHTLFEPGALRYYRDLEPCSLVDEQESLDALIRTTAWKM